MAQLIKRYEVKLTEKQFNTLEKLRDYNIIPSKFIERAVKPIHRFLAWIGCKAQR